MKKHEMLKVEMLVVVNDDFEDMDHEIDDALKTIENVDGVIATRVTQIINLDDGFDDAGPLYDDGEIWKNVKMFSKEGVNNMASRPFVPKPITEEDGETKQ